MPEDLSQEAVRQSQADPENPEARLDRLLARARVEGPAVLLEALLDREAWNRSHAAVQDAAIADVSRRLIPAFEYLHAKTYSCQNLSHRLASFRHVKTGAELILIPGGAYEMGSEDRFDFDARPVHACRIERPFLIGRYPLLQAEWDRPDLGLEDERNWDAPALPMEGVSWNDAQAWLNQVGDGLRLPSEAEWEYACRAGTATEYFWGDKMDPSFCWFGDNSGERTHAPAEHADKANAFGLVDMSGNAWEWCQDEWIGDYESGPDSRQPRGRGRFWNCVNRGGCSFGSAEVCRSSSRLRLRTECRLRFLGLRLARDIA